MRTVKTKRQNDINVKVILELEKVTVGTILTIGQSSLQPDQFKAFKRLVQDHFYSVRMKQLLAILGENRARSGQEPFIDK